jgi:hypothetical protein
LDAESERACRELEELDQEFRRRAGPSKE